jgi:hypothetical protein
MTRQKKIEMACEILHARVQDLGPKVPKLNVMPSIVLSRLKCRHKSSHSDESNSGNQHCGGSSHNVAESTMLWILALQSRVFILIQSLTWILWSSLQSPKALRLSELDAREEQSRTSATE